MAPGLPSDAMPVPAYAGYYVTPDGDVWSARGIEPRKLKPYPNRKRYLRVSLMREGKRDIVMVSHVVASAFRGPRPSPAHQARHWDGDNQNNHRNNVLWGTQTDNEQDKKRHGRTKLGRKFPRKQQTAVATTI